MNTTFKRTSYPGTTEMIHRMRKAFTKGKKPWIQAILFIVAAVVILVLLTGSGKTNIIGTWKCTGGTGDYGTYGKGDTYTFNEDFTYQMTQSWGYKDHGTYELKDGKLFLTAANGARNEWDKVERVGNTLREKHNDLYGYRVWEKE